MSDEDDDGVEPQIEDVNGYYFEDDNGEPVCFSILPFQFGENDNETDLKVFLHGFVDKILPVYKKVVAWKISLDSDQPNIYVLSIEHKWIKLLKPRKCYGDSIRSILITVQMLHFVRRGGQRSRLSHLWDHLDEVFGKYNPKPAKADLMKHRTLIKLFAARDQTLMKSKILKRLIENDFERSKKALGLEAQFIVSDRRHVRKNDDNKNDWDDGDDSSDDDDDSSDDDGTDQICVICDDGGNLLICEGPCKRSFHPTEKDGRESKCETLGYTSAEVKKIGTYLCANCKNKQHQCFRCGELEPSHGPNAKVFQCNKASCGYFYHPMCVAQLLDPNATDGACGLERRIMAGMSFTCPIHWCFNCGRMENKTQKGLKLAVCRRCPKAYHRDCLPREISFGTKDKDGHPRAWKLSKKTFIYCMDHEIDTDTGAASRNHIKFPATPECTKTKELGNSKGRKTGKRRKNTNQSNRLCGAENEQGDNVGAKNTSPRIVVEPHCAAKRLNDDPQIEQGKRIKNTNQSTKPIELPNRLCGAGAESEQADNVGAENTPLQIVVEPHCAAKRLKDDPQIEQGKRRKNTNQSTKPIELLNRFCGAEIEQADKVGAKNTSPQIVVEPHRATKRLKDDPQIEQSSIGVAASQNGAETMKGHEKQFGISSCVATTGTEKRVTCLAQKGTCLGTPYDGPSTKDMSDCSVQDTPVDKDVELENVACRITGDKYTNGREKTQEDYTRKETAHPKDLSENQGQTQNDVLELDNLCVEIQADESPLEPGNKRDEDRQENVYELGSASGEKETSSRRENQGSDRGMVPRNDSKIVGKGGTTVDNVDDHSSEGSYACQGQWSRFNCNGFLVAIDQDTLSDRSKKRSQPVEKASDGNKTDLDKNKKHNLREDRRDAHYKETRSERNKAADTSGYKCRDNTQSDRREEPVGRNTRARSREHSPERRRMDRGDSYPGTYNRQRCEWPRNVNSSRSGCDDRRQLSPCQSSFRTLPEFGGDRSHLYPRDSQYRTNWRHNPPQYLGIPQYYRPNTAVSVAGHPVCYRLAGGYGGGSQSSRPVTDMYAPHLERTNYQPRSQSEPQYDLRFVQAQHNWNVV